MGLRKQKDHKGFPAEYWRIGMVSTNRRMIRMAGTTEGDEESPPNPGIPMFQTNVQLDLYASKESRDSGLSEHRLEWVDLTILVPASPTDEEVYKAIMKLDG